MSKSEVTKESIAKSALPQSAWRPVRNEELDAAIDELTKLISKKEAVKPTWTRRLGVLTNGSGFVLGIDVAAPVLAPMWHCDPSGAEPHFFTVGYPLGFAAEMLKSPLNPELELAERRKKQAAFNAQQASKRAADAEAFEAKRQENAKEAQARADYHAEDWLMLNGLQRFAARLALAVESRDKALALDLRAIVAQSLAGDDEPDAFPRGNWFAGLGIESLAPHHRQDLLLAAQGERENAALEQIPRDKLPSLKLMNGPENRAGIVAHWRRILRAVKAA